MAVFESKLDKKSDAYAKNRADQLENWRICAGWSSARWMPPSVGARALKSAAS